MALINNVPSSQYLNVNVLGKLFIQGIQVLPGTGPQNIIEPLTAYSVELRDDLIYANFSSAQNIILPASLPAYKCIVVKMALGSSDGTISVEGGELIDGVSNVVLASNEATTFWPITGAWTRA